MLKSSSPKRIRLLDGQFAIVASRYNSRYVDGMLVRAVRELKRAGAEKIQVVRVPGAFEIPGVAAKLAQDSQLSVSRLSAIICLGVIFQGETSHAKHIGWGVTYALAQIQVQHKIPVIHGVFIFEKEEQARVRCLGRQFNRGAEAAHTALEMARVMKSLSNAK
jgi:6,7-dimethyl-8-ribityllumazine synthase